MKKIIDHPHFGVSEVVASFVDVSVMVCEGFFIYRSLWAVLLDVEHSV